LKASIPLDVLCASVEEERELDLVHVMRAKPLFKHMKFVTTLDRDEDGVWVAECPSIPGCISQGKTREEALTNIREAIALCLEVRAERGLPLTVETQQVEVAV